MRRLGRWLCWLLLAGCLLALALLLALPRPVPPGSLDDLYLHVHVGMSQRDLVALIRGCRDVDGCFFKGVTRGGESFADIGIKPLYELPPPQDMLDCVVKVEDSEGWEVEVTIGPGGVVTGKRSAAPDRWASLHRRLFGYPAPALGGSIAAPPK